MLSTQGEQGPGTGCSACWDWGGGCGACVCCTQVREETGDSSDAQRDPGSRASLPPEGTVRRRLCDRRRLNTLHVLVPQSLGRPINGS